MNRSQSPGFPNQIPNVDWQAYLPRFKDQKGDDDPLHFVIFRQHIYKEGVQLHDDSLIKMLMVSLKRDARS